MRRLTPLPACLAAAAILLPRPALLAFPRGGAVSVRTQTDPAANWDRAFADQSGDTPLHFTAHYSGGHGEPHHLEEWRRGQTHLRRKTDERIDLHADASGYAGAGQPLRYVWQILDVQKHIAHRVSSEGMLRLGMLYSYYSMAHLLTRPPGKFVVEQASAPAPLDGPTFHAENRSMSVSRAPCTWWEIHAPGQASTRICWMSRYGVPAQIWSQSPGGWHLTFQVETLDTHPIAAETFAANTAGFQVRNVDEIESDD